MTLYRHGEAFAHNAAEKVLFGRCVQDKARHIAYGLAHLRYAITHQREKALVFEKLLNVGETDLARELTDPVVVEALAVIFGGGVEGARAGMRRAHRVVGDFARQYLAYAAWLGIDRSEQFPRELARYMEA